MILSVHHHHPNLKVCLLCSHLSESAIVDVIASLMVLPNRMCFPLIDQVKVEQMKFPLPRVRLGMIGCFCQNICLFSNWRIITLCERLQGVVRVHVLEARDLVAKDTHMMGLVKGKSDPYTVLRVGNKHFKTKTIKETLNPRWNEVYEVIMSLYMGPFSWEIRNIMRSH